MFFIVNLANFINCLKVVLESLPFRYAFSEIYSICGSEEIRGLIVEVKMITSRKRFILTAEEIRRMVNKANHH